MHLPRVPTQPHTCSLFPSPLRKADQPVFLVLESAPPSPRQPSSPEPEEEEPLPHPFSLLGTVTEAAEEGASDPSMHGHALSMFGEEPDLDVPLGSADDFRRTTAGSDDVEAVGVWGEAARHVRAAEGSAAGAPPPPPLPPPRSFLAQVLPFFFTNSVEPADSVEPPLPPLDRPSRQSVSFMARPAIRGSRFMQRLDMSSGGGGGAPGGGRGGLQGSMSVQPIQLPPRTPGRPRTSADGAPPAARPPAGAREATKMLDARTYMFAVWADHLCEEVAVRRVWERGAGGQGEGGPSGCGGEVAVRREAL